MKVVLDTNVLVSGGLTPGGTCAQIVDLVVNRSIRICVDDRILDEYEKVLMRPHLGYPPETAVLLLEFLRAAAERIASMPLPIDLPDADDVPFLEVAAAADAVLVTGNTRHYPANARRGVRVVTPAEFVEIVRRSL